MAKKVVAGHRQRQESKKVKGGNPEGTRESSKEGIETPKNSQKKEEEVEKPEPERAWEPAGLEVALARGGQRKGTRVRKRRLPV